MVESGMSDGRCDFCPRPGRLVHCYCDNGHTDVGVWVCPEKHEGQLFDVESVDIACRQCDQQGSWVALREEKTVGPNPTVVPRSHRCRVYQLDESYRVDCPTCGHYSSAEDWYSAMGDARHHWQVLNLAEGNITINQLRAVFDHLSPLAQFSVAALSPDDNIAREDTR
jgi:hypothetical protein